MRYFLSLCIKEVLAVHIFPKPYSYSLSFIFIKVIFLITPSSAKWVRGQLFWVSPVSFCTISFCLSLSFLFLYILLLLASCLLFVLEQSWWAFL